MRDAAEHESSTITGPGCLVTRLLGVASQPGLILQHDHQDYTLLNAAPVQGIPAGHVPPSHDDFVLARPHPHAFFCPALYGWTVAALWPPPTDGKPSSQVVGLLGKCTALNETGSNQPAHHFVLTSHRVDPQCLLRQGDTGGLGGPTQRPFNSGKAFPDKSQLPEARAPPEDRWSLYTCSLDASLALTVSPEGFVEPAAGRELVQAFEQQRIEHPPLGAPSNKHARLQAAWELVWRIIDNVLFRAERRKLKFDTTRMTSGLGWDATSAAYFEKLGFLIEEKEFQGPDLAQEPHKRPALLRAWLESGLLALHHKALSELDKKASPVKKDGLVRLHACMAATDARPTVSGLLGGNHFQTVQRQTSKAGWTTVGGSSLGADYALLGCTSLDPDSLVKFAFQRQTTTDAPNAPLYLGALCHIAEDSASEELQLLVAAARESGLVSKDEIDQAYAGLGFDPMAVEGARHALPMAETPDEVVHEGYMRKKEAATDRDERLQLQSHLRLLAKVRGSDFLLAMLASEAEEVKPRMTIEKAYKALEGSTADTDDGMLVTMAQLYSVDNPGKKDDYRQALEVIADARDSKIIRFYLETGETIADASEMWKLNALQPPSSDRPVGLENIGNTCYLNSLLQYFFTIRGLREVILHCSELLEESDDIEKRVGGRRVSPKEIQRAKKFVRLLADLFNNLITAPTNSIQPDKELAYLALVTSQDEIESTKAAPEAPEAPVTKEPEPIAEDPSKGPDDPMDLDPAETLAETKTDSPVRPKSPSPTASVLGKRTNDHLDQTTDVADRASEQSGSDSYVMVSPREPPQEEKDDHRQHHRVGSRDNPISIDDDMPMFGPFLPSDAPPLPPRKRHNSTKAGSAAGEMMFGRQHDVSECMDNVMFQIEAALDPERVRKYCGTASIVQDLFYGKTVQTLSFEDASLPDRAKEEAFSYLLVDVADEGRDIYEGLDSAFEEQTVEIEGHKARRKLSLVYAPPILQIQLQRVQFDRKKARVFKSNAYMAFQQQLKMDRYMQVDPGDAARQARQAETAERRRRLAQARLESDELHTPEVSQVMAHFKDIGAFTTELATKADRPELNFFQRLDAEAAAMESKRSEVKARISQLKSDIERLWEDVSQADYELVSVFMHRGEANFGHYWLHQRALPKEPDRYFKFNDAQVTDLPAEEVFADTTGQTNNPYWLTYVHKEHLTELVQSVHRSI